MIRLGLLTNHLCRIAGGWLTRPDRFSLAEPFDLYVKATDIGEWRAAIDALRTLPEQRAAVIEFPKRRKIFIDGFVFVPATVA